MQPMSSSCKTILVLGGGLAGNLVTARLADSLGPDFTIIQICDGQSMAADALYGGATAPESYNFLRGLGLDEPTLLLETAASFSFGTHFRHWLTPEGWVLCHHSPFPTIEGIPLHHHVTREKHALEPLLVSAQAILGGRFAHPPADPNIPLSQAEYGYQFDALEVSDLLAKRISISAVKRVTQPVSQFDVEDGLITAVRLEAGDNIEADLVIDVSGMTRLASLAAGARFKAQRTIGVTATPRPAEQLGPPCREIEITPAGWTAKTHLQDKELVLEIATADPKADPASHVTAVLGHLEAAWVGNCVAIGHAASVFEPLTPAPMMMLQRDIERLIELIPVLPEMHVERREFNRRFLEDASHIELFHENLLAAEEAPETPYWRAASSPVRSDKLDRKIRQFSHRGILTRYDLEPFNDEDWAIAHWGMGRVPRHPDRQMDRVAAQVSTQQLDQIRRANDQLVPKMPPHHVYVAKLKQYLKKKLHA